MSKFCSKCGREISDSEFCPYCGAKSGVSTGITLPKINIDFNKIRNDFYGIIMVVISVICTIQLLLGWFHISLPFGDAALDGKYNCFNLVFKMFSVANQLDIVEDFVLLLIVGAVILILACVIVSHTITACRSVMEERDKAASYAQEAIIVSLILSIGVIVVVFVAQMALESDLGMIGGAIGDMLSLSSHPYILLAISFVTLFLKPKQNDNSIQGAMAGYARFLGEIKDKEKYKFILLEIDNNKTPELVVYPKEQVEGENAKIYKYIDGAVTALVYYDNENNAYVDEFGHKGIFGYKPRQNQLMQRVPLNNGGVAHEIYFISDDGKRMILDVCGESSQDLQSYKISGVEVNEFSYRDQFGGFTMLNEEKGYEINDLNIKSIFGV